MPRLCRSLAGSVLIVLVLGAAPHALAQRLNLGGPSTPKPGDGKAVLALAAELRDASPRGSSPADRASRALHFLASDLLNKGEATGPAGSARVLLGLKIAHRLPAFDAVVGAVDSAVAGLVAADLESLARAAPADVPGVEIALRDALAPIIRVAPAPWPRARGLPVAPAAPGAPASPFSDAATIAAAADLRTRLAAAIAIPAYANVAGDFERELLAMERGIAALPAWLTAQGRERLRGD
ncbi:MAG: hypothetical protein AABZ53_08640, partial [Planctomycetota bacterium]